MIKNPFPYVDENKHPKIKAVVVNSPCRLCLKSDVCKYKDKIDKDVNAINDLLFENDMLEGTFTCKRMKQDNFNVTYRGVENK